jgi:hypothetical protein
MEPQEPQEPQQPAQPAPVVNWETPAAPPPPPRTGEVTGALFANRSPSTLTLGDAFTTAFNVIRKPMFVGPLLVIGVTVNGIVDAALGPLISQSVASGATPGATLSAGDVQNMVGGFLAALVVGIIGGILINLYGQIWVVEASSGPLPTIDNVVSVVGRRWIGVIGTGIVVGLISLALIFGLVIIGGLAYAALGNLGILVVLALIVVFIWVAARLSMAGWLAAEGRSISESIAGSWLITNGNLLRIIGWGIAYGIAFAIISAILGAVLSFVPYVGSGIASTVSLALGYGAGVTLFRRTQAAAMPPAPSAPAAGPA